MFAKRTWVAQRNGPWRVLMEYLGLRPVHPRSPARSPWPPWARPLRRMRRDPVLVAAGDIACNPDSGETTTEGTGNGRPSRRVPAARYTANLIEAYRPAARPRCSATSSTRTGPVVAVPGRQRRLLGPAQTIQDREPSPCPGNHEYGAGSRARAIPRIGSMPTRTATGYFTYFSADQLAAEERRRRRPPEGLVQLREFPVGGTKWHVVALNSECASGLRASVGWEGGCDVGSEQERWLRADRADGSNLRASPTGVRPHAQLIEPR